MNLLFIKAPRKNLQGKRLNYSRPHRHCIDSKNSRSCKNRSSSN